MCRGPKPGRPKGDGPVVEGKGRRQSTRDPLPCLDRSDSSKTRTESSNFGGVLTTVPTPVSSLKVWKGKVKPQSQ